MILELNHVAIHVTALDRSCDFYSRVLRLDPLPRPDFDFPGAWFRLGQYQELHLIARSESAAIPASRSHHFALRVNDIVSWEQHLTDCGGVFVPKKRRPDGVWQIFLSDPDGNHIELMCLQTDPAGVGGEIAAPSN